MDLCVKCEVAPSALSLGVAEHLPEAEFLCPQDLAVLLRLRARPRCSRSDCNQLLLLTHCASTDTKRTVCARCALGLPPTVAVPAGHLKVRLDPNWYQDFTCAFCDAKMAWRMQDGVIRCKNHGGGQSTGQEGRS